MSDPATRPVRSKRRIARADLMAMADYAKVRKERRQAIAALKEHRRLEVGPHATFYFENYDTMWMQIHEMLFIERGGEAQIDDELTAYNPLIPQGDELIATLMFEIEEATVRERVLRTLGHVEDTVSFEVAGQVVKAQPVHPGEERTTPKGKTSSVHFLRFRFDEARIRAFRTPGSRLIVGFSHPNYGHLAVLPEAARAALAADFD
jgi:hypothetical protein